MYEKANRIDASKQPLKKPNMTENVKKCQIFQILTFITTSRKYFNWLVTRPGLSALGIYGGNTWPLMGSRAGSSPSSALGEPKFNDIFHLFLFLIFFEASLVCKYWSAPGLPLSRQFVSKTAKIVFLNLTNYLVLQRCVTDYFTIMKRKIVRIFL